ncbi:hypothetical protein [Rathayibacter sp. VKM Ac-2804]|uniref:hypothetical protein n=1 Tax=Rathayibacter sp. VKM Ac-2804 TaxID=2609257 RepID=UPI001FCA4630|nr:hypothetical protein [Rathayibacter sp. VKM Ac-2804]
MRVEILPPARRLAEARDVGHREAGRIRDLAAAAGDELAQRRLAQLRGGGQLAGADPVVLETAALGGGDDQVALEPGGVALELTERAGDVGAAAGLLGEGVQSRAEHGDALGGGLVDGAARIAGEVAAALDLGAHPDDPAGDVGAARVELEARLQLADDGVAEPDGLDQRDGGTPARAGGVQPPPDQLRHPLAGHGVHAAGVPDELELGQAPGDRLAQRLREDDVGGVAVGLRRGERGGVELRELAGRPLQPAAELREVVEERALRDRLAQAPRSDGRPLRDPRP